MVQVLPVPALASSRVVPVGSGSWMSEGGRVDAHRGLTCSAPRPAAGPTAARRRPRSPASIRSSSGARPPWTRVCQGSASSPSMPNELLRVGLPLLGGRLARLVATGARGVPGPGERRLHRQRQRRGRALRRAASPGRAARSAARWSRGPETRAHGRAPRPADGDGGPVLVGVGGAQGEQVEPGLRAAAWRRRGSSPSRTTRSPWTPDTVPVSRRPSPRSTSTSTARGSPCAEGSPAGPRAAEPASTAPVRPPPAELPRGRAPRSCSARNACSGSTPASSSAQQPVADGPGFQAVELDRHGVLVLVGASSGVPMLSRSRQEAPHRVAEEAVQVGEATSSRLAGRQRAGEEGARRCALAPRPTAHRPAQRGRS